MRRAVPLVLSSLISLALGAASVPAAGVAPGATSPPSVAARDAASLLKLLNLPPGATALRRRPAGVALSAPPIAPATPNLVSRTAYFLVSRPPAAVLAFIAAHPPTGSRPLMSGSSSTRGKVTSRFAAYRFAPTTVLGQRSLGVSVVASGRDSTALAEATDDVWLTVRLASERVPATAKTALVTITRPLSGPGARRPAAKSIHVSAPGQVAQLIAAVNSLPAAQPGTTSCPADDGAMVSIAFRATPRGALLAFAQADLTGCGGVSFALRGRPEPALTDGPSLGSAVRRILGAAVPQSW